MIPTTPTRRAFLRDTALLTTAAVCFRPASALAASAQRRSLFDGKSLTGWHSVARLAVPQAPQFASVSSGNLKAAVEKWHESRPELQARLRHTGRWGVIDGAVVGRQEPSGSGLGAYLLSDEVFGDFDLSLEARPDWPADTGIMVRAHPLGSVGFQVLLDHRPNGVIGGVFGNGVGNFRSYPFVFDGDESEGYRVRGLRAGKAANPFFPPDFAAPLEEFLRVWRPNEWNTLRIRCAGKLPVIETWINGVAIARLDTSKLADRVPGYDPEVVFERIGRRGHIGFEVHDNGPMGRNRWAPGAVCRWRNISIIEL